MEISSTRFLERSNSLAIKRCPKCQSVYLDNEQCESCGFNLAVDHLGEPLGKKSYYGMKQAYLEMHRYWGMTLPEFLHEKELRKGYFFKLKRRYSILLDYLLSDRDSGSRRRPIYWTEMKDLITDLMDKGVSGQALCAQIEDSPAYQEYRVVAAELINYIVGVGQARVQRDWSSWFKDHLFFGVIRLSSLLLGGFFLSITVLLALSWYQYFLVK